MRFRLRDLLPWSAALFIVLVPAGHGICFAQATTANGCGALDDPFGKDQCLRLSVADEVSQGATFERAIGGNLTFRLNPARARSSGWTIEVIGKKSKGSQDPEYSWVVTPPYHFYNPRYLTSGDYGISADDAVKDSPRDFNFVLDDEQYARASDLVSLAAESHPDDVRKTEAEWEKESAEAADSLSHFPVAKGRLTILDSNVGVAPGDEFGQIERVKFRVELHVPCDFSLVGISPDIVVDASSCSGRSR